MAALPDAQAIMLDCTQELRILRGLLADVLEHIGDKVTDADRDRVDKLIDAIGKQVGRMVRARNDSALTAAELRLLQVALEHAIGDFLPDPDQRRAYLSRVRGAFHGLVRARSIEAGDADAE